MWTHYWPKATHGGSWHSNQARQPARPSESETLALPGIRDLVIDGTTDVVVTVEYLGSAQAYPLLAGLQPDLYRCFMEQTWRHASERGVVTLIHPETHFTDEKAALLREHTYLRLRRHWQFINELRSTRSMIMSDMASMYTDAAATTFTS